MTIQTWLSEAADQLKSVGINSAILDAQILLAYTLNVSREWLLAHNDYSLNGKQQNDVATLLLKRAQRIPIAYIVKSKEFYGREFFVNKDVLIPRAETEAMIDLLKTALTQHQAVTTIVDIGSGSGVLAVTAQLEFPKLRVFATDTSAAALKVAKRNAQKLKAEIEFIFANLFDDIQHKLFATESFAVLANLPYVPESLITSPEITMEPESALFSGEDGLRHYTKFWHQIASLKIKPVFIITESLPKQHIELRQLASAAEYSLIQTNGHVQLYVCK